MPHLLSQVAGQSALRRAVRRFAACIPGHGKKSALMKPLRSKAVEQNALSSPLRMAIRRILGAALVLVLIGPPASAEIVMSDVSGTTIRLAAPARRIVSLAPHITELLFAAGAGDRVVGNVDYGDYPAAAKAVPKVGGYSRLDLEAIVALKPDLVMGWESGNAAASVSRLRSLGLMVHLSQPNRIEDIASELERIGRLAGTEATANQVAAAFRARHARLAARYGQRPPMEVFYQVWKQPLTTVNGKQIISDAIRLCGGRNVFANLPALAPNVSVEAVITANPEVIVASGMDDSRPEWLDDWRRWTTLTAVSRDNLYFVPPDVIQRHTPRILDGAETLCAHLETARGKRPR